MTEEEDEDRPQHEDETEFVEFFQQEALSHIREPDALNVMLKVVDSKAWLTLLAILLLFLATLVWALLGSITTIVEGKGILLRPNGVFSVSSEVEGRVKEVLVSPRQEIPANTHVATISDVDEEVKLARAQEQVDAIERELRRLQSRIDEEEEAKRRSLVEQLAAQKKILGDTEAEVDRLKQRLEDQKGYVKEGLFTETEVEFTIERLGNKTLLMEQTRASIADLEEELSREHRTVELREKELEFIDAKERLELLEVGQKKTRVTNLYPGQVLEVTTAIGHHISPGDTVLWMEHEATNKQEPLIYGFIPIDEGKRVQRGHKVQVRLSTVNHREFGSVIGWVDSVSQFAVSKSRMSAFLQNDAVESYLSGEQEALLQVVIKLEKDPNTYSGYRWTSGEGPPVTIETGAVGTLKIEAERVRPLYYLLPMDWLKRQAFELESEWEQIDVQE